MFFAAMPHDLIKINGESDKTSPISYYWFLYFCRPQNMHNLKVKT